MLIRVMALWCLLTLAIAFGRLLVRQASWKRNLIGVLLMTLASAYPIIGIVGFANLMVADRNLNGMGVPDRILDNYREHLRSDTVGIRARHVISYLIASDAFWKTGRITGYSDSTGKPADYAPTDDDKEAVSGLIKAKEIFRASTPVSFLWLTSIPMGILFGSLVRVRKPRPGA